MISVGGALAIGGCRQDALHKGRKSLLDLRGKFLYLRGFVFLKALPAWSLPTIMVLSEAKRLAQLQSDE